MTGDITPPIITTIIPTYRRPELLARAIKSVLNQTYPFFQVCIYDNASGDSTADIVTEFIKIDNRVKYFCHPKNIESIPNFNYGLQRIKTPFFSFLSDDDILLPDFFLTAMEGFNRFPSAFFSATDTIRQSLQGIKYISALSLWPREGFFSVPEGLFEMIGTRQNRVPTWTGIVFRREIVQNIGLLDTNVGYNSDVDFELRIATKYPFVINKKPCAVFYIHDESYNNLVDVETYFSGWLRIIAKLKNDQEIPLPIREVLERKLLKQLKQKLFTIQFILKKDFQQAYLAAHIIGSYFNDKMLSQLMYNIAYLCDKLPLFYKLTSDSYILLNSLKNIIRQRVL